MLKPHVAAASVKHAAVKSGAFLSLQCLSLGMRPILDTSWPFPSQQVGAPAQSSPLWSPVLPHKLGLVLHNTRCPSFCCLISSLAHWRVAFTLCLVRHAVLLKRVIFWGEKQLIRRGGRKMGGGDWRNWSSHWSRLFRTSILLRNFSRCQPGQTLAVSIRAPLHC